MSAKIVKTFSGKTKHCKNDCLFRGIIFLQNGRLLLLDYYNKKLKMLNEKCNIICSEETRGFGCGVTKVSDGEIALLIDNTIYFYNVTKDKFELQTQKIKIDKKGYGISYSRNIFTVICYNVDGTNELGLNIYTKSGVKIQSITSTRCKIRSIVNIDTKEARIYLSSSNRTRPFRCVSRQGQLLYELDFFGGDVVEINNFLLVTESSNNNIVLCTRDGIYRRTLIQDRELYGVKYITYNSDTQQICVTSSYYRNKFTVIQLSFEPFHVEKSQVCIVI